MKKIYQFFLMFICCSLNFLNAQCDIQGLEVYVLECYSQEEFAVTIDFTTADPSTIGYVVTANGASFGTFQYLDLPFTFDGIIGNCITNYNIVVTNLSNANCSDSQNIGVVCCDTPCSIAISDYQAICTSDDSIQLFVEINADGVFTDTLEVLSNDDYSSHISINDLNNGNFFIPSFDSEQTLVLCLPETDCCDTIILTNPCVCNIIDVSLSVTDCNDALNNYYLRVDFEVIKPSSDSFIIGRVGNALGTHAYSDLPIKVGPIEMDEADGDIFILDLNDSFCFGFAEHMTLDSCNAIDCEISNLTVVAQDTCDANGEVFYDITFDITKESVSGFFVAINGNVSNTFNYGEKSYRVGPLAADCLSQYIFTIKDLENDNCQASYFTEAVCCSCELSNLEINPACNENELSAIVIDFDYDGFHTDQFIVYIDGISIGTYDYALLPVMIPYTSNTDFTVSVEDAFNTNCIAEQNFINNCSNNCNISNFIVSVVDCGPNDNSNLSFTFEADNLTNDSIEISYNGVAINQYQLDPVNNYLIPFFELDCELDFHTFEVYPLGNPFCGSSFIFQNLECCNTCTIDSIFLEAICTDDMDFNIVLNFDYDGSSQDSFDLVLADTYLKTYAVNQLPIEDNFAALDGGDYNYQIVFDKCKSSGIFSLNCEELCVIENLTIEPLACVLDEFYIQLDFDYIGMNDSFTVLINGASSLPYALSELPLLFGPLVGDNMTAYEFTVEILGFESCEAVYLVDPIDCIDTAVKDPDFESVYWLSNGTELMIYGTDQIHEASLIQLDGQKLNQQINTGTNVSFKTANYPTGIYLLQLVSKSGSVQTFKIFL